MIKSTLSTILVIATVAAPALATGPANCPAGQTALAQRYGSSSYCAMSICVPEYKHADVPVCTPPDITHPLGQCINVKYEARPRFPQPPSPAGSWGNQAACPAYLNTASNWY